MKSSCFFGKVFVALGVCMLLLSMGVFVDQANAGCSCDGTCSTTPIHPMYSCNHGTCNYDSLMCGSACDCFPDPSATFCECR